MSANQQLVHLIRSHFDGDDLLFANVVEHMASDHELAGRKILANDMRQALGKARQKKAADAVTLPQEIRKLVEVDDMEVALEDLVLGAGTLERLRRILKVYGKRSALALKGLPASRKILLTGPSGTGKTSSARALAHELGIPLIVIRIDGLVAKFMGETGANLRLVFDAMLKLRGVWFFDEIDALAADRGNTQDVGEARRVLNSLLTMIEKDRSDGLIVAATNTPEILDRAIMRRFDAIVAYGMPSAEEGRKVVETRLSDFVLPDVDWSKMSRSFQGLAHADIEIAAIQAGIDAVLDESNAVPGAALLRAVETRRHERGLPALA